MHLTALISEPFSQISPSLARTPDRELISPSTVAMISSFPSYYFTRSFDFHFVAARCLFIEFREVAVPVQLPRGTSRSHLINRFRPIAETPASQN